MTSILFVCHGNICRSPMAEYVMKDLVRKAGLVSKYHIESAATSTEELGSGVYPPVRRLLENAGIPCSRHCARQVNRDDYRRYDLIIGMDSYNIRNLHRMLGADPEGKISLLLDHLPGSEGLDIADPWYTRDFHLTWQQVNDACKALLQELEKKM